MIVRVSTEKKIRVRALNYTECNLSIIILIGSPRINDIVNLKCKQKGGYGKRVNLQLKHFEPCWIWEKMPSKHTQFFLWMHFRLIWFLYSYSIILFYSNFAGNFSDSLRSCWCVLVHLSSQTGKVEKGKTDFKYYDSLFKHWMNQLITKSDFYRRKM